MIIMPQRLVTLAAVLSLLLSATTTLLWIHSYWVATLYVSPNAWRSDHWDVGSTRGVLYFNSVPLSRAWFSPRRLAAGWTHSAPYDYPVRLPMTDADKVTSTFPQVQMLIR